MIRPATPTDAEPLAGLWSAAYLGQFDRSAEQMRTRLESGLIAARSGELVAEYGGKVVGALHFSPVPDLTATVRFQLAGDPAAYTALSTELLTRLPGVHALHSVVREDHRPQMHFLHAAGFRNAWQSWGAHLDLAGFDFRRFLALEERLFLAGYEVRELDQSAPDALWSTLHHLFLAGLADLPPNPTTTPAGRDLDFFKREIAAGTVFAAHHRGQPVALTTLRPDEYVPHGVQSEYTATLAAHRRRGLATLTTARALAWGKEQGHAHAGTGGAVLNLPMLRVNQKLGYVPEPMWVTWVGGGKSGFRRSW